MATAPPSLRALVRAVVLQAPVSDREAWSLEPEPEARAALLDEALALVGEGRGRTILRELHYGFVPSAHRPPPPERRPLRPLPSAHWLPSLRTAPRATTRVDATVAAPRAAQ